MGECYGRVKGAEIRFEIGCLSVKSYNGFKQY